MNRIMSAGEVRQLIAECRARWTSPDRKVDPKLIHTTHIDHIEIFLGDAPDFAEITVQLPDYIALTQS